MPENDNNKNIPNQDSNIKNPEIKPLNESIREGNVSNKGEKSPRWDVHDTSTPIKKDYDSNSSKPDKKD